MDEKVRETITKYLGDMHALQSHGLQAMSRQVDHLKGKEHGDALRLVEEFKRTLESHVSELEGRMNAMGGSPTSPVKDAASAVAGFVAGLYDKVRSEEASKEIRDDYTFFSHSAIAYLMLHTTAKGLSDDGTAMLAERGYRNCARMVMRINQIMPGLVVSEMKQDGLPMMDVSQECHRLISDAWRESDQSTGFSSRVA
jgi:hypothetical protein